MITLRDQWICPNGPGTELKRILASWGFKEGKSCRCLNYTARMNVRGPKWCRNHVPRITQWLKRSAEKRKLPFSSIVARRLINQAIKVSEGTMNLRNFFERVYCVNLASRPDRWKEFVKQVPHDWPFASIKKFKAIDGRRTSRVRPPDWWKQGGGAWGCYRSHNTLIEQCLNDDVESVLLLEDDALFSPGFVAAITKFLEHVPDDWGMIYLGGQHLKIDQHPPIRINDWVYKPFNVNRTHAFALRGKVMEEVYRHINCGSESWHNKNHIDHHLGRYHQRRNRPIYCPREWLVGQAGGKSNISNRTPDDRYWAPAEQIATVDASAEPFVAVVGLHSSGSSCMAGILFHLGLHLGNKLVGFYGNDPIGGKCGYEAAGLMQVCEQVIPFPRCEFTLPKGRVWAKLKRFINEKRREAAMRDSVAAAKYPQLCRMGNQLMSICQEQLRVIHIDRPIEESIKSMLRRTKGKNKPRKVREHQQWLAAGKEEFFSTLPAEQLLTVQYHELLKNPRHEIMRVIEFLGATSPDGIFKVSDDKINRAENHVSPEARHILSFANDEETSEHGGKGSFADDRETSEGIA